MKMKNGGKESTTTENPTETSSELANALEANEFFLVYQPTIDLQTNAFAGVESLLRWRHRVRGIINPEEFLPELERTGQIVPVGRWALHTACAQGATWHEKGYRFAVSVNVSIQQFEDATFAHDVEDALSSSLFDPSLLVLEFPFSILSNDDGSVGSRLQVLHSQGVGLAIDDLRPSETAFTTLEEYPVSVVKLDRRFIAELATSDSAETLIVQLVDIAKTRNLQIIASGVEDAQQRRRLQHDQVNIGQGFLFSEPHEAADIDRFLEDFSIFSGKPL
jgi:EAL domain-containing protein (putative c-di-GMP-specific phosphodiesterase class I)